MAFITLLDFVSQMWRAVALLLGIMAIGALLAAALAYLVVIVILEDRTYLTPALGVAAQLVAGIVLVVVMPWLELFGVTARWNNCWWFAAHAYWLEWKADPTHTGRVVAERSQYGWWFHFYYIAADGSTCSMWTTDKKHERLFPPPIFKGYVLTWWRPHEP